MPVDAVFFFLCLTIAGAYFSNAVVSGASALVVLIWLVRLARGWRPRSSWPFWRPALAFLLASLLSAACSRDPARSFSKLHEAFLPLLLYAGLPSVRDEARALLLTRVTIVFAVAAALLGLFEFATQAEDARIQGSLGNWMTYSQVLLLAAPLLGARLLWLRRSRASLYEALALALLAAALLCSKTRGVWLGGLVAATLLLALRRPKWVLAMPLFVLAAYFLAPSSVQERVRSLFDRNNVTLVERTYMWRSGQAMLREHPLLGIGPAQVKALYPEYRLPDDPRQSPKPLGHLHSNPVQIAAERGLLGLAAWLWFWLALFRHAWRAFRAAPDERARARLAGVGASLFALQVAGLTEYNFGDSEVTTLATCLMLLLFVPDANAQESSQGPESAAQELASPG